MIIQYLLQYLLLGTFWKVLSPYTYFPNPYRGEGAHSWAVLPPIQSPLQDHYSKPNKKETTNFSSKHKKVGKGKQGTHIRTWHPPIKTPLQDQYSVYIKKETIDSLSKLKNRGSSPRFAKISNALFDLKKCSDMFNLLTWW